MNLIKIFNYLLDLILSYVQQKTNRVVLAADDDIDTDKAALPWIQQHKERIFEVNVLYNQRKYKVPKQFSANNGLESRVKEAQDMVSEDPTLIASDTLRKQFLKQSPKAVSKYLCNTICKYLHLKTFNASMPSFQLFYIDGVANSAFKWQKMFAWQFESRLIGRYIDSKKTIVMGKKYGHTKAQMIARFMKSKKDHCLIRIKTGPGRGHTFIGVKHENEIIMYDTFHNHWSGKALSKRKCNITYLYWFDK